jgi:beta-xylosidase
MLRLLPFRAGARALLFGCALPLVMGSAPPSSPRSKDFADPFVLRVGETYYAFATGSRSTHVQAARSSDLETWAPLGDALPRLPAWASDVADLTWAPAVLPREKTFVLYYTARHTASGFQCISHATSASVAGPYVDDSSSPFVCTIGGGQPYCGSIDPSPFLDEHGKPHLLWKSDENSAACQTAPRLWSQPLSDDGLELVGAPTALLTMDRGWERPIIEGPSMVVHDGQYTLFYSANEYETAKYAVGYAQCAGPAGPCTKVTKDAPLLKSSGTQLGPGGQEFFTDPRGEWWMAFHAWTAPRFTYRDGGARSLHIAHLAFDRGVPLIDRDPLVALSGSRSPGGRSD